MPPRRTPCSRSGSSLEQGELFGTPGCVALGMSLVFPESPFPIHPLGLRTAILPVLAVLVWLRGQVPGEMQSDVSDAMITGYSPHLLGYVTLQAAVCKVREYSAHHLESLCMKIK